MAPKGRLIIIGGKEDKKDLDSEMKAVNQGFIPKEILKLIATSGADRIEVVTSASSEPEEMKKTYTEALKQIGYNNFGFLYIKDYNDKECLERIKNAKTVFLSGGDQSKICDALINSDVADLIRKKYNDEEDFTLAGTSAGAMCLSTIMISDAINGEAIVGYDLELKKGLSFIDSIVDTHFIHRSRFGRLAHATILHPDKLGIGLGEDTSLVIENGCEAVCKGSGMVLVINSDFIKKTNVDSVKKGCPVYAENLIVDILTEGCSINLKTKKITPPQT
jgi:cyanophycinase